jgi:hypothetical protein
VDDPDARSTAGMTKVPQKKAVEITTALIFKLLF